MSDPNRSALRSQGTGATYQSVNTAEPARPLTSLNSNGRRSPRRLSPRQAYRSSDIEASITAHKNKVGTLNTENHGGQAAEFLKSIVYGGLDGIITTFATVTSVAGADFSAAVIVVLGISHLFADGLSMGMGDAMSSQAEMDYNQSERRREKWEMDNNMEGEIEEMVELYMGKGLSREDSETIIHTLAKYEDAFLDHMMVEELGLMPPDDDPYAAIKAGVVTMIAFMLFGCVPLLPYLLALIPGVTFTAATQLWIAVIGTVLTLFALGAFKGAIVDVGQSWYKSGLMMAFNGSFAAAIGYFSGYIVANALNLQQLP